MKTEQVNIYKFSELSKEVQEKVLDKMREINTDWDDWYQSDFEVFKEDLQKIGVSCESFCFDLYDRNFYMVKPNIDDTRKFLLSALSDERKLLMEFDEDEKKEFDELVDKLEDEYTFGIHEKDSSRYGNNFVEGLDEIGDILGIDYDEYLKDILKDFLKQLQESYDYLSSDEAVKDTIEANEYDFLEDGERW
jgi:hypothetical protein